jgi:hypothetical protein
MMSRVGTSDGPTDAGHAKEIGNPYARRALREEQPFLRKRMEALPQVPAAVMVDSDLFINIARLPPLRFS